MQLKEKDMRVTITGRVKEPSGSISRGGFLEVADVAIHDCRIQPAHKSQRILQFRAGAVPRVLGKKKRMNIISIEGIKINQFPEQKTLRSFFVSNIAL